MSHIGAGLDNMVIECLGNLIILLLKFHNFHLKSTYFTAFAFISEVCLVPPVRAIVIKKKKKKVFTGETCMGSPHLSSPRVGKCTLSLTSWVFMVWEASAAICYSPLLQKTLTVPQRPGEPHNLSNTRQGGGPDKVWDHPARSLPLFISSSTPNSPENGPLITLVLVPVLLLPQW